MSESVDVVERSKPAPSTKSAGSVTRKDASPEELLEILGDLVIKLENSGIKVGLWSSLPEKVGRGIRILVMDVQIREGKIQRIREPEK